MKMRCCQRIWHTSYKDHTTNDVAIGLYEDMLLIVSRRKLQWYGHVVRSNGLGKDLASTVPGRRKGMQERITWKRVEVRTSTVGPLLETENQLWRKSIADVPLRSWCFRDTGNKYVSVVWGHVNLSCSQLGDSSSRIHSRVVISPTVKRWWAITNLSEHAITTCQPEAEWTAIIALAANCI